MTDLHLTCGDLAGDSVRALLAERVPAAQVRVLRDDLAVGPLADIDTPPCAARVAFWEAVWPPQAPDRPNFSGALVADADWLAGLSAVPAPQEDGRGEEADEGGVPTSITVWHGDSASEQLMLARMAAALEASGVPLLEIACGTGDSRVGTRMAVSMHSPEALAERFRPLPMSAERQAGLAAAWREQRQAGYLIRRWRDGRFHGEDFASLDAALRAAAQPDFAPLARAMAEVMAHCDGFFPTDFFLYWRTRELATAGALELQGEPAGSYPALHVRRV